MTHSKHTPAPWAYHKFGTMLQINNDAAEMHICRIEGITPEDEANVCLIAAAPDLLDALKDTLRIVELYSGDRNPGSLRDVMINKARAAIAKAAGI